jgi:hypothetical protein
LYFAWYVAEENGEITEKRIVGTENIEVRRRDIYMTQYLCRNIVHFSCIVFGFVGQSMNYVISTAGDRVDCIPLCRDVPFETRKLVNEQSFEG